jgi:hypothetical protein
MTALWQNVFVKNNKMKSKGLGDSIESAAMSENATLVFTVIFGYAIFFILRVKI